MQSTGHTSTHAVSFVPMHGSQMMYAIVLIISQTCDPALRTLYTPPRPKMGQYEVCTSEKAVEHLIAEGGGEGVHFGEIEALEPLDAFGTAGAYNRFAVARLFGGRRVRVARGWRISQDVFESITLLSPYPDAEFSHLNPGTMRIILRLRLGPGGSTFRGDSVSRSANHKGHKG
jgi:hypothetical protein